MDILQIGPFCLPGTLAVKSRLYPVVIPSYKPSSEVMLSYIHENE